MGAQPARESIVPARSTSCLYEACSVLHVDLDAFFASVEVLDDPSLAGKAVIVGGASSRGVVASCSYEARVFGIHSAMSSIEARRRCPHAVFLPGRHHRYAEMSGRFYEVLREVTPFVEGLGLDEAFLDVSGVRRIHGTPVEIADALREKVAKDLHLACCVGVARTKLLAKLASRAAKPTAADGSITVGHGVVVVDPSRELSFLHPLPVRALWGVGPATAAQLTRLGVSTVGDLAQLPEAALCSVVGKAAGRHLAALARGRDDRGVVASRQAKSVGHEQTFSVDIQSRDQLHRHLVRLADAVSVRLREAGLRGRTVRLKVRFADRRTVTRARTLTAPTNSWRKLASVAEALIKTLEVGAGVRLLGLSVASLDVDIDSERRASVAGSRDSARSADVQHALPLHDRSDVRAGWDDFEAAVARVRARYGHDAVAPAAVVGPDGAGVGHGAQSRWGPEDAG